MSMNSYTYYGPLSGFTLANGQEVLLQNGQTVTLPAGSNYIKSLVAQGYLVLEKENVAVSAATRAKNSKVKGDA